MLKYVIEAIYWFYQKFLTNNEAFDEVVKDERDYELDELAGSNINLPEEFNYNPYNITDQRKDGYRMSCTAQSVAGAANTQIKYKKGKRFFSPFKLWDIMVSRWLWGNNGAYLRHAVETAKKEWNIDGYYKARTVMAIKLALYKTNQVCSGSTTIDWKLLVRTGNILSAITKGNWHAFWIKWWNKIWFICQNSYWKDFWLNEFIIPYHLVDEALFNSTYALVVDAHWSKYSQEQLLKKYQVKR